MPIQQTGVVEILQDAATALGNGTPIDVKGATAIAFHISGTFVATVLFEGTLDDTTWVALGTINATSLAGVAGATGYTAAAMAYLYNDMGLALSQVRARISAYTSGSVTVRSRKQYN